MDVDQLLVGEDRRDVLLDAFREAQLRGENADEVLQLFELEPGEEGELANTVLEHPEQRRVLHGRDFEDRSFAHV